MTRATMSNFFSALVLSFFAFALGVVIGETYAPLSGGTIQSVTHRMDTAEGEIDRLRLEYKSLDAQVTAHGTQLDVLQPKK